jgi:hypothetical protein
VVAAVVELADDSQVEWKKCGFPYWHCFYCYQIALEELNWQHLLRRHLRNTPSRRCNWTLDVQSCLEEKSVVCLQEEEEESVWLLEELRGLWCCHVSVGRFLEYCVSLFVWTKTAVFLEELELLDVFVERKAVSEQELEFRLESSGMEVVVDEAF